MAKVKADFYNPAGGAYARRDFLFGGVRYLRGDVFPFGKLGISEARVAAMWRAQRISFGPPPIELVTEASDRRHGRSSIPLPAYDAAPVPPAPPADEPPQPAPKHRRSKAAPSDDAGAPAPEDASTDPTA